MVKGLYAAYTGMINQQNKMDVISNNLANAATTGYKKEGSTSQAFDSVLAYKIKDLSEPGNLPSQVPENRNHESGCEDRGKLYRLYPGCI